jgi:membrane peptidoglycan carboxypeptidase
MDISIHEAERIERQGRRFVALTILAAITIISASWLGLLAFLTSNSAFGTVQDMRKDWIPDVEAMTLDLPDLSRLSELYTADGVLLGKLTERNSQPTPLDDIPNLVIAAVLSAEDGEFMEHGGVDYQAVVRALVADLGGGPTQGGSTITQQVVKQNFVGNEPTLRRKVAEAAIAIELERRFTKEQILEFYLNSIFFGNNAYGVKAAAQEYFEKDLDELSIAEAAALPIPIRNPSLYDLRRESEIPVRARDAVIDQMVEEGYITPAEALAAKDEPIVTAPPQEFKELAPQVAIAAREELLNDSQYGLGATFLQRKRALFGCPAEDTECEGGGGLKIFTTVDFSLQEQAQEILLDWFPPGRPGPSRWSTTAPAPRSSWPRDSSSATTSRPASASTTWPRRGGATRDRRSSRSGSSPRSNRGSHSTHSGTTRHRRSSTSESPEHRCGTAPTPGATSRASARSRTRSSSRRTRCSARSPSRSARLRSPMSPIASASSRPSKRTRRRS